MLVQAGQMTLSRETMAAFDTVWADPSSAKFGIDGEGLQNFCVSMV